jgi:hypothetical protein
MRVEDVLKIFLGAFSKDEASGEATSGCTIIEHVIILTPSTLMAATYLPLAVVIKLPAFI